LPGSRIPGLKVETWGTRQVDPLAVTTRPEIVDYEGRVQDDEIMHRILRTSPFPGTSPSGP
jgi:hypothetical protein